MKLFSSLKYFLSIVIEVFNLRDWWKDWLIDFNGMSNRLGVILSLNITESRSLYVYIYIFREIIALEVGFFFCILSHQIGIIFKQFDWGGGVLVVFVVNLLDYNFVESKFGLLPLSYTHFLTNTRRKGINFLILITMGYVIPLGSWLWH